MKIGEPILDAPGADPGDGVDHFVNVFGAAEAGTRYLCPCCGYPTLATRGSFDVCAVCDWEDDGQDSHDADRVRGGPNGDLSLAQAIRNFADYRASSRSAKDRVRAPTNEEMSCKRHDV